MHTEFTSLSAAVLLSLCIAGSAFAADERRASAHATVSDIHIVLIDLDLNDGIAPALVYRDVPEHWSAEATGLVSHKVGESYLWLDSIYSATAWGAGQHSKELLGPADIAAGRVFGQTGSTGTSLEALLLSADAQADNIVGDTHETAAFTSIYPHYFYLSPNTELSISFDLTVGASIEGGQRYDRARSSASFSINNQWFSANHDARMASGQPWDGQAGTFQHTARLVSGARELQVEIGMGAYAETVLTEAYAVAPVPEPHSWAMMLGGLGLIGAMARRRKLASRTA